MTVPSAFLSRPCPSCGSHRNEPEISSDPPAETLSLDALRTFWSGFHDDKVFFSYHRCSDCKQLFAPVFFTEDQLAELYADLAPNMDIVPSAAIAATQRDYFTAVGTSGEGQGGYLEIGPDVGHVVRHAARTRWFDRFWLFEPNRAVHGTLAAAADPYPREVYADMSDLSPVPERSIGLAVMIHVLDHLLDPVRTLEAVRRTLRPGATLMIVTHNEASLLRRATGTRWPPFCLQHPAIFSPASISAMLRRAGFSQVTVQRSKNYFPLDFLVNQAGRTVGLDLKRLPLPKAVVGLKLGNIMTLAIP